ncbi:hypothetical protein [Myroides sp. DW712]|uniref:hypothetical protein n=1 Tax=Myroides sp. DW712 TaxID=3389800 RepID=UPI00397B482D
MKDSTSIVSSSRYKGSRCDDEEMFRDDPIHFISKVDVYTLTDFSSDYPANSLLNDLITVEFYNNFNNESEARPLDQWNHYLSRRAKLWEFHKGKFTIRQQPSSQPNQIFSLIFTLSDDTILETITHEIVWE